MVNRISLSNDSSGNLLINYKYLLPCGAIVNYAGSSAPTGWLICDGSSISTETYSTLFEVIRTTYGSDASGVFCLPDLRQRIPVGKTESDDLGETGGNSSITLTTNQMPSHYHTATIDTSGGHTHTASDSGHAHSYEDAYFAENRGYGTGLKGTGATTDNDNDYYFRTPNPTTFSGNANITVNPVGNHSHGITINSYGGSQPINIRNPYIVLNYIIKY